MYSWSLCRRSRRPAKHSTMDSWRDIVHLDISARRARPSRDIDGVDPPRRARLRKRHPGPESHNGRHSGVACVGIRKPYGRQRRKRRQVARWWRAHVRAPDRSREVVRVQPRDEARKGHGRFSDGSSEVVLETESWASFHGKSSHAEVWPQHGQIG